MQTISEQVQASGDQCQVSGECKYLSDILLGDRIPNRESNGQKGAVHVPQKLYHVVISISPSLDAVSCTQIHCHKMCLRGNPQDDFMQTSRTIAIHKESYVD